jgi:hypothetical protein
MPRNTRRLNRLIRAKIDAGLKFMAEEASELYRDEVTAKTHPEYPEGAPTGDPFPPPHSEPGEFPDRETGQGEENITFEAHEGISAFGVLGVDQGTGPKPPTHRESGGMHLIYLVRQGRLGPEEIVLRYPTELIEAFRRGADSVRT